MRPASLRTKIFLDSGDPKETKELIALLGFLDGQTTNPTLISKNPEARGRLERGEKFTEAQILKFYKDVVEEISGLIPSGSVSVEVYADKTTSAETMLAQGREMFSWISNAHVKFPVTSAGLSAAEKFVVEGGRVNMTLCFTQAQALAVYEVTRGAEKGQVFVSPFVGRLDDQGENGMDLIRNILAMFEQGDGHVEVLTASVRNLDHFLYALALKSDIITAPYALLKEWSEKDMPIPGDEFVYDARDLRPIPYKELDLNAPWQSFDIAHPLTEKGMDRFSADWNALIR